MLDFDQSDLSPTGNVRRDILKRLLGVTAVSALTPEFMKQAIAAEVAGKTLMGPRVPDVKPTQLTDKLYVIKAHDKFPTPENLGFFTNITFIVTSKGVVVLDPSASVEIGRMAIRMIKTVTPKPVVAVINTHYHGDHWMGNQAFAEQFPGIPMYSMKESADAIKNVLGEQWIQMALKTTDKATRGTIITPPNRDIKDGDVLDFGDTKLDIHHYGKCHTPYDLLVGFRGTPYMHVGDVLMGHRMAGMGDNEGSFLEGMKVLDKIKSNFGDRTFIPGHGKWRNSLLAEEIELFQTLYNTSVQVIKETNDDPNGVSITLKRIKQTPFMQQYAKVTPDYENSVAKWTSIAYLEAEQNNF